jgi:kinetochore protein Mis13/DSN1
MSYANIILTRDAQVDVLHQASHAALQYSATAKRFLDGIFASLAQDVRNRDRSGAPSTLDAHHADRETGAPPNVAGFLKGAQAESPSHASSGLDILKSLSADDDPSKGAEMMRLLESLPPVPPSVRRPVNPSSTRIGSNSTAASGSMTPRRLGSGVCITPRKIGRLGSSTPRRERELSRGPSPSLAT